jgi:plastocyanin
MAVDSAWVTKVMGPGEDEIESIRRLDSAGAGPDKASEGKFSSLLVKFKVGLPLTLNPFTFVKEFTSPWLGVPARCGQHCLQERWRIDNMRQLFAAAALAALACGGGDGGSGSATPAAASAAPVASTPASAAVHKVEMVLNAQGEYRFVPSALTLKVGDTVQWVNVSGGPHNVQFRANGIPAGADAKLNEAMPNRIGPLNGALLTVPNATYEISFAGAPTGTYNYTCTPHELLGMSGTLTVQN